LEYDSGTLLYNLLADIPDNRKAKIVLIVPIRNISKEEAETLALLPANKQAKSPTGTAISKKGGQGKAGRKGKKATNKKKTIKEEVKEEKDIKIEEEIQEDSNDFPEAYNILCYKRRNHPNSKYPANQYNIN
jgi:hypothetical protein